MSGLSSYVEKYGAPGKTDPEGFNPYADTVGPGIYGGIVKRNADGTIVIGKQYQNHNPRPGPVYAGGGYTPSTKALKDINGSLVPLLEKYPDLNNDITTGGASPLHMCGMSRGSQHAVSTLVKYGADVEALDTYGMTPLHRMASNNLPIGAKMLIQAGCNPAYKGKCGITPMQMAERSGARDVVRVIRDKSAWRYPVINILYIRVSEAGVANVNGKYVSTSAGNIPTSFARVCEEQKWDVKEMWTKLNGQRNWYKHESSNAYIYFNNSDLNWWIDGPDGLGVYIVKGPPHAPPAHGWQLIKKNAGSKKLPLVSTFREISDADKSDVHKKQSSEQVSNVNALNEQKEQSVENSNDRKENSFIAKGTV